MMCISFMIRTHLTSGGEQLWQKTRWQKLSAGWQSLLSLFLVSQMSFIKLQNKRFYLRTKIIMITAAYK